MHIKKSPYTRLFLMSQVVKWMIQWRFTYDFYNFRPTVNRDPWYQLVGAVVQETLKP